jgi:hypothetical protein
MCRMNFLSNILTWLILPCPLKIKYIVQDRLKHYLLSSGQIIFFYFLWSKVQNFFPNLGGQIIYFIYMTYRMLTSFHHEQSWNIAHSFDVIKKINQFLSTRLNSIHTFLLLLLLRYLFWWTISSRWYHPPSSQCFIHPVVSVSSTQ